MEGVHTLPIPKDYLHSVCEVRTPLGRLLASGTLQEISPETIQIAPIEDQLPTLHCDTLVCVQVLHEKLEAKSLIGKVFLSTSEMMRLADVQNLSDFDRRNFFRLRVNMNTQAYLLNQGAAESVQLFPVRVTDLSLSGCFVETKKKLETGNQIAVFFPLPSGQLSFICRIQRVPQTDEGLCNGYGCLFPEITKRQADLLCQYIFETQREQILEERSRLDFDLKL